MPVADGADVVLVEDDAVVREWLRAALQGSEFRLTGVAATAEQALRLVPSRRPDLVLIDHRLRGGLGANLVRDLRRRGVSAPTVLMSAHPERGFNETAREAGAQGTVLKSGNVEEILSTFRRVLDSGFSFDTRYPKRPPGRASLSPREREVLQLVAGGATNREAAAALGIGEQTVKTLLARAYRKLGVSRRSEAVAAAYDAGLL